MTRQEALEEAIACLKQFIEEEAEKPEDRWDRDGLVSRAEDALHYMQWPDADEDDE
jgi:hypothetical protein